MKSGCALKKKEIKTNYIFCSPYFLFGGKIAP